jgi:hypothetical protein
MDTPKRGHCYVLRMRLGQVSRTLACFAALSAASLVLAPTGEASGVPKCAASHLKAWAGGQSGTAGGNVAEFAFVNKGASACSLIGYPKLQMLSSAGAQISTTDHSGAGAGTVSPPRKLVVIKPGKRAYFFVSYYVYTGTGSATCPTAAELALTPPGSSTAVTLSGSGAAIQPFAGSDTSVGCGVVYVTALSAKPTL